MTLAAVLLVLLTTMVDPIVSVVLAAALLATFVAIEVGSNRRSRA